MDRTIVLSTLLLVGLTWLLYKLAVLLEPRGDNSSSGPQNAVQSAPPGNGNSSQKLIHQRLRK